MKNFLVKVSIDKDTIFDLLYFLGILLQFVAIFTHYIFWAIGCLCFFIWVYFKFIKTKEEK